MRQRGQGSIRKRKDGGWAIRYYRHGREFHESVATALGKAPHLTTPDDAERLLRRRYAEMFAGKWTEPEHERATMAEILALKLGELALRGAKALPTIRSDFKRLEEEFGEERAARLTTARIQTWMTAALARGAKPATVHKQAAYLGSALRYAVRTGKLTRVPHIPTLKFSNARQGFWEAAQIAAVIAQCPEPLPDLVRFAHATGWRRNEILGLTWPMVDLRLGELRIPDSKNDEPQILPLVGALREIVEARFRARALGCAFVFHRHGQGLTRSWYHKAWMRARKASGLVHLTLHDFRRTVWRDMLAAGVDSFTIMDVTHHKTTSIAKRYALKNTRLMAQALARRDAAVADGTRT